MDLGTEYVTSPSVEPRRLKGTSVSWPGWSWTSYLEQNREAVSSEKLCKCSLSSTKHQALVLEQLLPVLPGLVQSILDGQLSALHLVHDAQLHLIAQLKAQQPGEYPVTGVTR